MRGDLSIPHWNVLFLSICLCLIVFPAWAVDLPEMAPIPKVRDEGGAAAARKAEPREDKEELPQEAPLPNERPHEKPSDVEPATPESSEKQDMKSTPDKQSTREEEDKSGEPGEDDDRKTEKAEEPEIPPPLSPAGQLCRGNLRALGVTFTEDEPVENEEGCAIPHPLSITTLSKDIAIEPAAELNCMMAETLADFMQDVVQPAAERHFAEPVKAVRHASAFVCRPRNGTRTLSEHAFGNALDIAAFILADGSEVAVKAYDPEDHASLDKAQFLNEVRAAACGPFTTVLGPGSNADHATHFHFDLKERNNRYKVCE